MTLWVDLLGYAKIYLKIYLKIYWESEHSRFITFEFWIELYYTNMYCCRVQWCSLLHCGNVILPKAKITPETLIFPKGL